MYVWVWLWIAVLVQAHQIRSIETSPKKTQALFEQAMYAMGALPKAPPQRKDFRSSVEFIPQYDKEREAYDVEPTLNKAEQRVMTNEVIPKLRQAADRGHVQAMVQLADLYMFGKHSVTTDYRQALHYYKRAIDVEPNGHVYFMLGFIYSTGLFGELEEDQALASMYYQFGVENDDVNSLLAMAYRLSEGIGTSRNCPLALVYYSKAAKIGYEYYLGHRDNIENGDINYNIKITDFIDGIFGDKVSESFSTITFNRKEYVVDHENDLHIETNDRRIFYSYLTGLDEYEGYYDAPRNFPKAAFAFKQCIELGSAAIKKGVPQQDLMYIARCEARLGHMYLKGQGVEKDYEKALNYLTSAIRHDESGEALNDLGELVELGVAADGTKTAAYYYSKARKRKSAIAPKNLAKLITSKLDGRIIDNPEISKEVSHAMYVAAMGGDTEALYLFAEYLQIGMTIHANIKYSCSFCLHFYKKFVHKLQPFFFPHLQYALESLGDRNYKNALVAYSVAAEQGLQNALVSAGWLLYQSDPLSRKSKKTFNHERAVSAIRYFERASDLDDIDTTLLLGDIFLYGIKSADIPVRYNKAFNFYKKAAEATSSHGCFGLAYMYEYGLGVANNSVDYFLAKRYYDKSIVLMTKPAANPIPIQFALVRLRIKYLIWGDKTKGLSEGVQPGGWLSVFNKLSENRDMEQDEKSRKVALDKARAHHEGTAYQAYDDEYTLPDYIVIGVTVVFFSFFLVKQLLLQYRRMQNRARGVPEDEQDRNQNNIGWNFNFGGGNIEVQFFAL